MRTNILQTRLQALLFSEMIQKDMTQVEMAKLCGISQCTLYRVLYGKVNGMNVRTLKHICDAFNVDWRDYSYWEIM